MKRLSPNEIKDSLMEILKDITQFCEQNDIEYYLAWGTLLGSVRHHGFIPWDDDIDIWMPRPDYNRFARLYKNETFRFRSMLTEPYFPLCFGKVCDERYFAKDEYDKDFGLYVDIFPIDGLPSNMTEARRHIKHIRRQEHLWSSQVLTRKVAVSTKLPFKKLLKVLGSRIIHPFFSVHKIQAKLSSLYEKYGWEESENIIDYSVDYFFNKNFFQPSSRGYFEGEEFRIPRDYDSILTLSYGEYMVLPPESKRINHGIVAFLK